MNSIIYIIYLYLFSKILCDLPTFEIEVVHHESTKCDREKGYFQFIINGKGKGITEELRVTLPLKSPPSCNAVCEVSSTEMFCTIDAMMYDLSGAQIVEFLENEPNLENLKIPNWVEFFSHDNRILNHATNCESSERRPKPDEGEEHIFAAIEEKNIEVLGCFRNKNNFSLKLTKIKGRKTSILKDDPATHVYFEIAFEKPKREKALCVIPEKDNKGIYKVDCAMKYGGEIEVGKEASGTVIIKDKKYKIVFRGILIPPTIIDECKNDDKLLANKRRKK